MYDVSDRFLDAIAGSHRAVVRVQALPTSRAQFGPSPTGGTLLPLLDGDVKLTSRAAVKGTVDFTISGDYWELLQPYGVELFAERGVDFGDGTTEWVPLGYYGVDEVDQDDAPAGPIKVSGSDRMRRLQRNRVVYPVQFPAGTTHRTIFGRLVNGDVGGGQSTEGYGMFLFTPVPIIWTSYDPDRAKLGSALVCEDDASEFLAKLADARNCVLRFARTGELLVQPRDIAPGAAPVYTVRPGPGGNLIRASRKTTREGVYNLVVARGSDPAAPTGYRLAYNDTPGSPLRWTGPFGVVPRYYASPLIQTFEAADVAAETVLARYKGLPSALSMLAVPNPALEPLDVIAATIGATTATHLVDEVRVPLVGAGSPEIVTRTLNEIPSDDEAGGGGGTNPIPNPGGGGTTTGTQLQAAQLILTRLQGHLAGDAASGIDEDWTWAGAPAAVGTYNDTLLALYRAELGAAADTRSEQAAAWLAAYVAGGGSTGGGTGGTPGAPIYAPQFADGTPWPVVTGGATTALGSLTGRSNVTISGGTWPSGTLTIKDCANVVIRGVSFPSTAAGDVLSIRGTSHHILIENCTFGPSSHPGTLTGEAQNYIFVGDDCHNVRIEWCELRNKARAGNGIRVYPNFTTGKMANHVLIAHNRLRSFHPAAVNDFEPIRLGVSTSSRQDSYCDVFRNVFEDIRSEPEIVSLKSNKCRVIGNTVDKCAGSLVSRHGRGNVIADNHVIDGATTVNGNGEGSGGTRFYDSDHEIAYNTFQQLTGTAGFQGALQIHGGDAEGSSTDLAAHWRVLRAKVHHNTVVECATPITVGGSYPMAPQDCVVTDNLVAASGSAAISYLNGVTPGSIGTVTGNLWNATPAGAGMTKDADGVWRKPGVGSRLVMLKAGNVGPTASTADRGDGAGRSRTTGGTTGGGGTPVDQTTAAGRLGWGTPIAVDELNYSGAPDPSKWGVYDGPGHAGNGVRSPDRVTVDGSKMVLTGLAGTPNTAGLAHRTGQRYGKWEVRMRSEQTGTSGTNTYNVLLILWPDNDAWPEGGEIDFVELSDPGQTGVEAFWHYPSLDGNDSQIYLTLPGVDTSQWHNYAVEWNAQGITAYVDGVLWTTRSGGGNSTRRNIQDPPGPMHLTVQLDATQPSSYRAAKMEVDWVRVYPATPVGGGTPDPGGGGTGGGTASTPAELLKLGTASGYTRTNLGVGFKAGDAPGTSDKKHVDFTLAAITNNLVIPGYFEVVQSPIPAVRMTAYIAGGTTPNSTRPRTEFRELASNGVDKIEFDSRSGTHRAFIDFTVRRLPVGRQRMCVVQLHDSSDDVGMVLIETATRVVSTYGDSGRPGTLDSSFAVGERHQAMIEISGGQIRYFWDNMTSPGATQSYSGSTTSYFKSGNYQQSDSTFSDADDYAVLDVHRMYFWHSGYADPRG